MSSKKPSETGKKGGKQSEYEKNSINDLGNALERKWDEKCAKKAGCSFSELLVAIADGRVDMSISFYLSRHEQSEHTEV